MRVLRLIAKAATGLFAPDTVNNGVFTKAADGTQIRKVSLRYGHGDAERQVLLGSILKDWRPNILGHGAAYILYHVVDMDRQIYYTMIHAVEGCDQSLFAAFHCRNFFAGASPALKY